MSIPRAPLNRRAMLASSSLWIAGCGAAMESGATEDASGQLSIPAEGLNPQTITTVSEARTSVRRQPRYVSHAKLWDITFDHLKFEMEAKETPFRREMLTPEIEKLLGQRVRLRGFMHDKVTFTSHVTEFALMRDNMECCFGPGAWIYDCVWVVLEPELATRFQLRPLTVEGRLEFHEEWRADYLWSIYRLIGESVR